MSMKSTLQRWLLMSAALLGAAGPLAAHDHGHLPPAGRRWAMLVIEDHPGMREAVWDAAFNEPALQGAFLPNHRYALRTTGTPALLDLGCWDEALHYGGDHCGEHGDDDDGDDHHVGHDDHDDHDDHDGQRGPSIVNVSWTPDKKGVILRLSGKATWLPVFGAWDGTRNPPGTFRGAYLNWLLQARSTTPAIPKETRWQRLQRGAQALATQLLSREGGAPAYRMEGIGSSGRLLIPPGEGLSAARNAIERMAPAAKGYALRETLDGAVELARELNTRGGCQPGLVIVLSDGWNLQSVCGTAQPYEDSPQYPVLQQQAASIAATSQAAVWAWNVEGSGAWNKVLSAKGLGLNFEGDAVSGLQASLRAWMQGLSNPPQIRLALDQPALTRLAQAVLTITLDRPVTSATLNGQPLTITSLETTLSQTLKEGLNTFTVRVQTPCGAGEASISATLDTLAPRINLNPAPPALVNTASLRLDGTVDDPAAALSLNGASVPLDSQGRFSVAVPLAVEGDNPLLFSARDAAGNEGRLEAHVQRDTVAPVIELAAPAEGLLSRAEAVEIAGRVDDLQSRLQINGQPVPLKADGFFALSLPLPEGPAEIRVAASDPAGNQSAVLRHIVLDRTAPIITLDHPLPALVALSQIHVAGAVDDATAKLTLNGQIVAHDAAGRFVLDVPLAEGANVLSFRAVDAAVNEGALEEAIQRDTAAPVITLSAPTEGLRTNAASLQLVGQVDDASAAVAVNGQSVALMGTTFTFTATPPEGPFTFIVVATDPAGNASTLARNVIVDRSGPVITLDQPLPALTSQRALPVAGRIDDPSATLTLNNAPVDTDSAGAFTVTVQLAEGANTLHFVATDPVGNQGALNMGVVLDTIAPTLAVATPVNGLITNQGSLPVQGAVDDPSASVFVNGVQTQVDAQGRFTALWPLPLNGINTLFLQAVDASGNTGNFSLSVLKDAIAPVVTLTTPAEGLLTRAASIQVEGQVDDPTATVAVNGAPVPVDSTGRFIASVEPAEGPFRIQAVAVDQAGNQGLAGRNITVDRTPPAIALSQPVPPLTKATHLAFAGHVDDPKAAFTVNGHPVSLDATGAFSTTVDLPIEGVNTLTLQAVDLAGNVGALDLTTTRDSLAPVITILAPQDGAATNQRTLTVRGKVDDPSATLTLQGQAVSVNADGTWESVISASREGVLSVRAEAMDAAGNLGQAIVYAAFDWTPPALAWADPTPAEKSRLLLPNVTAAVALGESALISINGQPAPIESNDVIGAPFLAQADLRLQEGHVVLEAQAVDGAGNQASIFRLLDVGLTRPALRVSSPEFLPDGTFTTANPGVQIAGSVVAEDILKPLTLTLNGSPVELDGAGNFSLPFALAVGANPIQLVAATAVGQTVSQDYTITRLPGAAEPGDPGELGLQIDWPLEGFASASASMTVRGRVRQAGLQVQVNGADAVVDPQTLTFTRDLTLTPGSNTIQAVATAGDGRTASAEVRGAYLQPGNASYTWDLPANGAAVKTRQIKITGRADQPGIVSVAVNGAPMSLADGAFSGTVTLATRGRNALLMEVRALTGETRTERRDVTFEPELPRILLSAPDAARPGQDISISVQPDGSTQLQAVDLSWGGRLLARLVPPFAPVSATVSAEAVVGSKIAVEALATDVQGEQVTARAFVTVYDQGALLVEAFNDRTGLLLGGGVATLEGGESRPLDASGRASLATALPSSWVQIQKADMTPVWRSAGLTSGGAQAVVDARLTPFDAPQTASPGPFTGIFAQALTLQLSAGTLVQEVQLTATPLSTQGLPALLPAGWSAVSAWWVDAQGQTFQTPATASLSADAVSPLPAEARFVWVRWDVPQHQWVVLEADRSFAQLTALPMPSPGGYALVVADPGAVAPPAAQAGAPLPASLGAMWREGLQAAGSVDPSTLPTVEAIRGARAIAELRLGFAGADPLPSGIVLQTDVLESYTLVSAGLIEPEGTTQDAIAARWMLEVVGGRPKLTPAGETLGLRLPLRLSRTFGESDLVEGRIVVGFYHDGVQVAQGGSTLFGPQGGTLSRDGVALTFGTGAFSGSTLVRLSVDPGDPAALWPELSGQGTVLKSFQVDIVGQLLQGLQLTVDGLGAPAQAPLLLQRRVVQGQRVVVVAGALAQNNGRWTLSAPEGGNPVMEGGNFAVLVPDQPWQWVSGIAVLDPALAQGIRIRAAKAQGSAPARPEQSTRALAASGPAPVGDVLVQAGYLPAVSGLDGRFAVPAFSAAPTATLQGQRWDLGISGSLTAAVPSSENRLDLATVPFRIVTALPSEGAEAGPGAVMTLLLSGPADPVTVGSARLFIERPAPAAPRKVSPAKARNNAKKTAKKSALALQDPLPDLVELPLRRSLSQDGKTLLLVPEQPLPLGSAFQFITNGLQGLSGETAPTLTRRFRTAAAAPKGAVDFSRIKLTYPDGAFNITVTIPQGAVPPGAAVQIEAPGIGSVGTGTMLENQDLVFQMKASLGERLNVRVQLRSGEVLEGFISRYEATDGSGRVTVSMDGGRVEALDGSGAAVMLPEGALDGPVELRVEMLPGVPADLDPEIAQRENIAGRIRLTGSRQVELKKRPVIEMPAPANPSTLQHEGGLGAYAVYYQVNGFEPDGTPAVYFELNDSAAVADGKLVSKGGLPDDAGGLALLPMPANLSKALKVATSEAPAPALASGKQSIKTAAFGAFGFGLLDALTIDSGEHYLSGGASIYIGDQDEQPARGAYIFASSLQGGTPKRSGQMLGRTDIRGRYLFASSLTGELIRGGARLLGVDADYGVTATATGVIVFSGGIRGTLLHGTHMNFYVPASQLGDRVPPYAELTFEVKDASGAFRRVETARPGDKLYAVVRARDDRAKELEINLDLTVDERRHPACSPGCGEHPVWSQLETLGRGDPRGLYVYRFPLEVPAPGSHRVNLAATDPSCNRAELSRELLVFAFGEEPLDQPGQAPRVSLRVDPNPSATRPDSAVGVAFSEPVSGVGPESLFLEYQENGGWAREAVRIYGPRGEVSPGERVGQVFFRLSGKLRVGTSYRVSWSGAIQDGESLALEGAFPLFRTAAFSVYPAQGVEGKTLGSLAAIGNRSFVVEHDTATGRSRIGEWYLDRGSWSFLGYFGPSAGSDFYSQIVVELKAFEGVALSPERREHVLLVTTEPQPGDREHQSVLWAFSVCAAGAPRLVFAMSLGPGSNGYTPSVDYRDGVIVAGRLTHSIQLIDVQRAVAGWADLTESERAFVRLPGGANVRGIFQSFWLGNPEDKYIGEFFPGTHKMVGLLPSTGSSFDVAVGYSQIDAGGIAPLSGLSTSIHAYTPDGAYVPQPPFIGGAGNGAPDVRAHGTEGLNPALSLFPFRVIPNATVTENGIPRQATLVVGMHYDARRMIVVDASEAASPRVIGQWEAPEGTTLIRQRRNLSYDAETGWLGFAVMKNGGRHWLAVDVSGAPVLRVVSEVAQEAHTGVLQGGVWRFVRELELMAVDVGGGQVGETGVAGVAGPRALARASADPCPVNPKLSIVHPIVSEPDLYVNIDRGNGKGNAPTMLNARPRAQFTPDPEALSGKANFEWTATITYPFLRRKDKGGNITLTESFPKTITKGGSVGGNGWAPETLYQDAEGATLIRGGILEVQVRSEGMSAVRDNAHKNAITVNGENPTPCEVRQKIEEAEPDFQRQTWLKRIAAQESNGGKQFNERFNGKRRNFYNLPGQPVLNASGDGGMGIFQITPTSEIEPVRRWELLWRWDRNVEAGAQLLRSKVQDIRDMRFPDKVRRWANGDGLRWLNAYRAARNLPAFTRIEVPDYPDPETYILEDAIRYFNGFGPRDPLTWLDKHEFFPPMMAWEASGVFVDREYKGRRDNKPVIRRVHYEIPLVLDVEATGDPQVARVKAWGRYPISRRVYPWSGLPVGDPNYVEHVRTGKTLACR